MADLPSVAKQYATPAAKIKGHLLDTPEWLVQAADKLPTQLAMVLRRLLAKEPEGRIASAQEVAELLAPLCVGHQVSRLFEDSCDAGVAPGAIQTPRNRRHVLLKRWLLGAGVTVCGLVMAGLSATAFQWGVSVNAASPTQADSRPEPAAAVAVSPTGKESSPEIRPSEKSSVADHNPERATTAATVYTSEPKQTANASAVKVKYSAPLPKNEFQPLSNRVKEPWN